MKRVLILVGIVCCLLWMSPADTHAEGYTMEIDVTSAEYGANGTDTLDDYQQIQKALSLAWQKNISLKIKR